MPGRRNDQLYRLLRAITKPSLLSVRHVDFVLAEFWSLEGGKRLNKRALYRFDRQGDVTGLGRNAIRTRQRTGETNRTIATNREANRSRTVQRIVTRTVQRVRRT